MAASRLRRHPEWAGSGTLFLMANPAALFGFAPPGLAGLPDQDMADPGFGSDPAAFHPRGSIGTNPPGPGFRSGARADRAIEAVRRHGNGFGHLSGLLAP